MIIIIGFNSGHPHSGSYRPLYPDRSGIWKVLVFAERRKPEYPEKTSRSRKQTQPTYDAETGN